MVEHSHDAVNCIMQQTVLILMGCLPLIGKISPVRITDPVEQRLYADIGSVSVRCSVRNYISICIE